MGCKAGAQSIESFEDFEEAGASVHAARGSPSHLVRAGRAQLRTAWCEVALEHRAWLLGRQRTGRRGARESRLAAPQKGRGSSSSVRMHPGGRRSGGEARRWRAAGLRWWTSGADVQSGCPRSQQCGWVGWGGRAVRMADAQRMDTREERTPVVDVRGGFWFIASAPTRRRPFAGTQTRRGAGSRRMADGASHTSPRGAA